MWEEGLPAPDASLRQGDLLQGVPFPKRCAVTLTADGVRGPVSPSKHVVVLDQSCTVQQRHTVLLGVVGATAPLNPGHQFLQALEALDPKVGPYSYYEHLLAPHATLDVAPGKRCTIKLLERVSLTAKDEEGLAWLRPHRVARMTPLGRARLRAKLAAHFGSPEDEDLAWLRDNGFDEMGMTITPTD